MISIIIPSPYTANWLFPIFECIAAQSYPGYEVIVVSSNGNEREDLQAIINCDDPRIKTFSRENDRDSSIYQAFNRSVGEFILILDCNDRFKYDKFDSHIDLFNKNPAMGGILSASIYASFDEGNDAIKITGPILDMADQLNGGFFSFSDGMFRREWFVKFFQDKALQKIEAIPYLALCFHTFIFTYGCRIMELNKAMNFRFPKTKDTSIGRPSIEETKNYIKNTFHNPSCILCTTRLSKESAALVYLNLSIRALEQNELGFGQLLFKNSIWLDRSILDYGAHDYFMRLFKYADREFLEIEKFMQNNIEQLPPEFAWISEYLNAAIGRCYFYKAVYNIVFDRICDFDQNMEQVKKYGFSFQEFDFIEVLNILETYEVAFGFNALNTVEKNLIYLRQLIGFQKFCRLHGRWRIRRALTHYYAQNYSIVPKLIVRAILVQPMYLYNRGIISIFIKSLFNSYLDKHSMPDH